MEIRGKEKKGTVELRCDSRQCWKCSDGACEERFEDLVYGVGP